MASQNIEIFQNEEQNDSIEFRDVSEVYQYNDNNVNTAIFKILKEVRSLKVHMQSSEKSNKKIITKLTEEIISLRDEVAQLKSQNLIESDTSLLPSFPFLELTALKDFDDKLLLDDKMRAQLKRLIERVGGCEVATFIRSAIKNIVSDQLAINITWRGTPEKPSIQQFTIFSIIKDVCHSKFQSTTDSQINKIVQQHFLHAKDRVLKRKSFN